jgi:hypothetical protein
MVKRDENGKVTPGSVLNPKGRPKRKVEDNYLVIFRSAVSPDDWKAIIDKAVIDAKRGDAVARKFIADYLIGAPVQKIDAKVTGDIAINWGEDTKE